jgi:hypothetical protein
VSVTAGAANIPTYARKAFLFAERMIFPKRKAEAEFMSQLTLDRLLLQRLLK